MSSPTAPDLAAEIIAALDDAERAKIDYTADPVRWAGDEAGVFLWSKQREVIESVRDNRRTAVHSCHNVGKTFTAAVTAAWWIASHPPGEAFILSTAPTAPQVKALLWREIGRLHGRAGLLGRVNLTEWYIPNKSGGEELVAFGRTTSKDNEAAFQGVHSKYVLVILDEASGVDPKIWQAAESIASNRLSRILAIGNPDLPHSPLATACRPESPYNVIHIGIEHAPATTGEAVPDELLDYLISPEWAADMLIEWGEESALYQAKVLGHFPTGAADPWRVISEIHAAACRYIEPAYDADAVRVGGLDVGAGGDRTVLVERVNDAVGRIETFIERDPEAASKKLADVIRRWGLTRVNVDTIGVGWGLAGMLRKELRAEGIAIEGVSFARKSNFPKRFVNIRAEAWWHGRELSRDKKWSLAKLDDNAIAELTMPRFVEKLGRILVEPKEDVKERLGRSPDIADAVLLAFFDGIWIPPVSDARGAFDNADLLSGGANRSGIFPGGMIPGLPTGVPTSLMRGQARSLAGPGFRRGV
jgi:hypothetical protein